ncbi:helix-turn-helix transcriptional regulator [Clostridiaceae bacterium Marseille-Q4145]|nr:helix-turn-helix transcriptional regulator [Clostridiaceae bacterium Marseille-Q4145]
MAIDRSLVSGSMGMLILRLLSEKDMYGYEMIDTLKKRSENVFELKAGTLYPLLHGLEEKRFLNSYEQEVLGKVRKYYQITPEGRKHLEQKKEEWKEYSKAVGNVLAMEV